MVSFKIDDKIKQELQKYNDEQETSTEMSFIDVLDDYKYRLKMVLDLEALAPIYSGAYGQSIHCKFLNQEQATKLAAIEDLISSELVGFESRPLVNDDAFFLKLQTKDGKYKAEFDVPVDASEPEKIPIKNGTPLAVFCKPGVWVNYKTGKAGVYLQIDQIKLNQEAPKKKASRVRK